MDAMLAKAYSNTDGPDQRARKREKSSIHIIPEPQIWDIYEYIVHISTYM
jgi:hypothetical protein